MLGNFESFVIELVNMQHLAMFKWHVSWARTDMNLTGGWGGGKVIRKKKKKIYRVGRAMQRVTEYWEAHMSKSRCKMTRGGWR